jgi:hypothetical protein
MSWVKPVDLLAAHRLLDQRAQDLHALRVGRQRVRRHHPAALRRQLPGNVRLVIRRVVVTLEPEGDRRQLLLVVADHLEPSTRPAVGGQRLRVLLHLPLRSRSSA